ncbi:MAG: hypothetical protein ACRCW9_06180 [Cetobacterium sp.]
MNKLKFNQNYLTIYLINGKPFIKQKELFKQTKINLEHIIQTKLYDSEVYCGLKEINNIDYKKLNTRQEAEKIKQLKLNVELYLKEN